MLEQRLALIPPLSMVENYSAGINGTYMLLPQLMSDRRYQNFIRRISDPGSYVIMDNGAYEAEDTFTPAELFELCQLNKVNELVIPDILGDKEGTLGKLHQFSEATTRLRHKYRMRYMLVAQGKTIAECLTCVTQALEQVHFITTIGLPKHLVKTVNENARVVLAARIKARHPHLDVHFLGQAPSWPDEIAGVKSVRSMDTSMPFAYAWHNQMMGESYALGVERPSNYFNRPADEFPSRLIQRNINQIVMWMND